MSGVIHRPDTQDAAIWQQVFADNEYRLPDDLTGKTCLDIGLHVGSFSAACKARNAGEVWGVEIDTESLSLALHNVHATPGNTIFQAVHAAAWRSDRRGDRLRLFPGGPGHQGCNRSMPEGVYEVPTLEFDVIVKMVTDFGRRRLDWLKLDCEGAEWPILFTARSLHLVDHIVGEYHAGVLPDLPEIARVPGVDYSIDDMKALLERAGFAVEIIPPNFHWYNLFFAHRVGFGRPG